MDKSPENPDQLIKEIINFVKAERELYGDFTVPNIKAGNKTTDTVKPDSVDHNASSPKQTQPPTTFSPESKWFQEINNKQSYYQIDQCKTLSGLKKLCEGSNTLRTDLEGTQLVYGVGNTDADLVIIGEAPGASEDRLGEPFVGKAGQLLNKILKAIDFNREEVYITNILKHRPPNNRNPKEIERQRSLPFLLRQIDIINPKLILSLGKVSAQTLLNRSSSLSSMRGSFHSFRDKYQLLATYHPAALLRHSQWKKPTWKDVQLLRKRYDALGGQP